MLVSEYQRIVHLLYNPPNTDAFFFQIDFHHPTLEGSMSVVMVRYTYLVGALEHLDYFSIIYENNTPN